ncbi:MAG: outer membrane protein OmpA-like peptidoglycan-associated protein [Cyclobacteriaceae bacterium]|jgi:outer membrane protein OmpA-like peptidoglycan-associated protein/Tol biopolymer transport system component
MVLLFSLGLMSQTSPPVMQTLSDTINYYRSTSKPVDAVNTEKIDYAPSISADGKTMIFESNKSGQYWLYESQLVEGVWSDPTSLTDINSYGDATDLIGGPSLSFDNNTLFFFASFREGLGREDIYYSTRTDEGWTSPKNIGGPINTTGYEGFPSISADGRELYFVRQTYNPLSNDEIADMWENKACYSIFKSVKQSDGSWGEPIMLPYPINQDCEKAPRIMADNKTLIFASNRLGGLGDYDLYQIQLDEIGDWGKPKPLEFINTANSDQFTSISAQGDLLYYVYDSKDIYSVEIPPHLQQFKNNVIQGAIRDGDTGQGIEAEIIVSDAFTSREVMKMTNNANNGNYTLVLPVGNNYNVEIKKAGYTSRSYFYDLKDKDEYDELVQNIELFSFAKLFLNVYDIDIFEPIAANIKVKEAGAAGFIMDIENETDGKITLDLPLGKKYEVYIDKENFESEFFSLDVTGLVVYRDFNHDVEMVPIKREVSINIADLSNNSRVRSKVRIRNRNRDEVIELEGNETVALRVGDRYEIEATSDQGYAFNSAVIEVTPEGEDILTAASVEDLDAFGQPGATGIVTRGDIKLALQPLTEGTDLTLRDILFESNSDNLDAISYTELERVITLMIENPSLRVEVGAHTDDIGSSEYNQLLSQRRAQKVANFMVESKISDDRFVVTGLGESQPAFPNDTDENRAKNRRVVLTILGI